MVSSENDHPTNQIGVNSQYLRLKDEFGLLSDELAKLSAEKHDLQTVVRRSLEADYWLKIGKYEYELFLLSTNVSRIRRKIELIRSAINANQPVILLEVEGRLDAEFSEWKAKIETMEKEIKFAQRYSQLPNLPEQDSLELKKLFRECTRKLHPDLNPDQTEHDKAMWQRLMEAYSSGDLEEVRVIEQLVINYKEIIPPYSLNAVQLLENKNLKLKKLIENQIDQLHDLKQQYPYNLETKIDDPQWVAGKVRDIQLTMEDWRKAEEEVKAVLEELMSRQGDKL